LIYTHSSNELTDISSNTCKQKHTKRQDGTKVAGMTCPQYIKAEQAAINTDNNVRVSKTT